MDFFRKKVLNAASERASKGPSEWASASEPAYGMYVRASTHARARVSKASAKRNNNTIKITIKNTITNTQYIYFTFSLQKR